MSNGWKGRGEKIRKDRREGKEEMKEGVRVKKRDEDKRVKPWEKTIFKMKFRGQFDATAKR